MCVLAIFVFFKPGLLFQDALTKTKIMVEMSTTTENSIHKSTNNFGTRILGRELSIMSSISLEWQMFPSVFRVVDILL